MQCDETAPAEKKDDDVLPGLLLFHSHTAAQQAALPGDNGTAEADCQREAKLSKPRVSFHESNVQVVNVSPRQTNSGRSESSGVSVNHEKSCYSSSRTSNQERSTSQIKRDAKKKAHDVGKKYARVAERSKTKNHTMCDEIDAMVAERRLLSPRGVRFPNDMNCWKAVEVMNRALERVELDGEEVGHLSLETFIDMLGNDELEGAVDQNVYDYIFTIRDAFARDDMTKMVAKLVHVKPKDLNAVDGGSGGWARAVDPCSFVMIISNAIVLAVSTDIEMDWKGWDYIEFAFTTFFVLELSLKMRMHGVAEFFIGADRAWNIADFFFVAFAVIDAIIVSLAQGTSNFQMFTLMRLFRLCRITRLLRLLRFKIFKELLLMIQGIVAGLRTLLWAIVLLVFVIFCLGMLIRQTLGRWCMNGRSELCHQDHLAEYGPLLFKTVPRACFTVFRCFTEGCASVDGTPLLTHIYENSWYGQVMVYVYILCFLAVTFGLFNLIMAVFVENTMESAKLDERKRRQMKQKESVLVARKLQRLVLQFSHANRGSDVTRNLSLASAGIFNWFGARDEDDLGPLVGANLSMEITREMFRDVVSEPAMEALLQDLEISVSDPMSLFDTLDADESGSLDISELIRGIMKLRGTADKSDVIASLLSIRSVQKTLKKFEAKVLQGQKSIKDFQTRTESRIIAMEQRQPKVFEQASSKRAIDARVSFGKVSSAPLRLERIPSAQGEEDCESYVIPRVAREPEESTL